MSDIAQQQVLLVDDQDRPLGLMEKIEAHRRCALHRAFSAFVFRFQSGEPEVLLQKRAESKYHFGGLWTNACCGHPLEGQTPAEAARVRLQQEMNIDCELHPAGSFIYKAQARNELFEHELDHVVVGTFESNLPAPNPAEADGARWVRVDELKAELEARPNDFTPWFTRAFSVAQASGVHLRLRARQLRSDAVDSST